MYDHYHRCATCNRPYPCLRDRESPHAPGEYPACERECRFACIFHRPRPDWLR